MPCRTGKTKSLRCVVTKSSTMRCPLAIAHQGQRFQKDGQPVLAVDAKKKEPVGDYGNAGEEWEPRGRPRRVRTHDFPDDAQGSACLYGVYDLTRNAGW